MSGMGIYGLSGSGIDVDSMVRMGMMSRQNQYDKMYKEEVKNEWIKEAYSNVYNDLNTFNSSTLYNYKLSATTSPMSAASSNSTAATAVANADAAAMSHTVNVTQMASNAYLLTGADGIKRANTTASSSIYLKDVLFTSDQQSTLKANMSADTTGELAKSNLLSFDIADGTGSTANKETISFTYEEILTSNLTLNDLASRIKQSGVNIKASYDSANDAFSLYQKEGGADNKILLSINASAGDAGTNGKNLLNNLNMGSVTQTTDSKNNITSTLSSALTVQTTAGVSSVGGTAASYTASVTLGADSNLNSIFKPTTEGTTEPIAFTLSDGTDDHDLAIEADGSDTVQSLMDKINASDNFTATLSDDGKLTIEAKSGNLSFKVDSSATTVAAENGRYFVNELGLSGITDELSADTTGLAVAETTQDAEGNEITTYTQGVSGQSAKVTIDGRDYTSDTAKLTVGNVTYTLGAIGSTTVTVSQDTDKLIENVKKFVEDYNKIIDELNDKYYEQTYSDYGVLTQNQEKGMTQEQIDKWNEKAKSGLLNHDNTIGKVISEMRQALYTPVEGVTGKYNTMMSIGITSSTDRGHITLDEDKLKTALAAEPDSVRELFNSSGDYTDENGKVQTDYDKQGVIGRISDSLYKNLKTMKSYAGTSTEAADGSSLGDLIRELQTKMSNFKTMMKSYENLLYKKYDAMEIAIQRMSVSMGYITGGQ